MIKRKGTACVELAFVLPLFLIMFLGMLEFGRIIGVQQILTNASREGSRALATSNGTVDDAKSIVTGYCTNASINGVTVTATDDGTQTIVHVSVPYSKVSVSPGFIDFGDIKATSVFRKEKTY